MTRRICLFGGSFNPPHVCHVLASAWALSTLPIDELWWVPTYQHAFGKGLLPMDERVHLSQLAIADLGERVVVSRVEEDLGGESRTIDTLRHLWARQPQATFSLLIGSDILEETHAWKEWDEIERTTPVHVLGRAERGGDEEASAIVLPNVSSTAIRGAIARRDHDFLRPRVPAVVLERILEQGHYIDEDRGD